MLCYENHTNRNIKLNCQFAPISEAWLFLIGLSLVCKSNLHKSDKMQNFIMKTIKLNDFVNLLAYQYWWEYHDFLNPIHYHSVKLQNLFTKSSKLIIFQFACQIWIEYTWDPLILLDLFMWINTFSTNWYIATKRDHHVFRVLIPISKEKRVELPTKQLIQSQHLLGQRWYNRSTSDHKGKFID